MKTMKNKNEKLFKQIPILVKVNWLKDYRFIS